MKAIILAGGKGTRLRPFTYSLPKPLMPIGGEMPILEIILTQLKKNEFTDITIAVNYMAKIIKAFFGDGSDWGLSIDYSFEEKPLSTIGPLTLIGDLPENFLVMNGDILTDLNYKKFLEWHVRNKNEISIATYKRSSKIEFGVLKYNDNQDIFEFVEKPEYHFNVSMGVYALNKSVIDTLPKNEPYGFDQLMIDGIKNRMKIKAFPHDSYWLDIGRDDDFQQANEDYLKNKKKILSL
ncbi:MAG: sugar phosphate nucleotidyltransferase [Candidatus Hermodarchaeota archaeon]